MKAKSPVSSMVFKTRWGYVGIAATERGLVRVTFPAPARESAERALREFDANRAPGRDPFGHLQKAREQIVEFFEGKRTEFDLPIDFEGATRFTRDVWRACGKVPYGETRSYHDVARSIGRPAACRAVGQALGANSVPIVIPCHRILRSDGSLGGFGGGLAMKEKLLALESSQSPGKRR